MNLAGSIREHSSYKDTDAAVFRDESRIYRKINKSYTKTFNHLMTSGLYKKLTEEKLLIEHKVIEAEDNYIIIEPQKIFITYPWEWCFSKIKEAALATLKIQKTALEYNMTLKDANYFNIQFVKNRPVLIDTTSFEIYREGGAWCAYRQFCENFLTVLSLMAMKDIRLKGLILSNINGIPLDLTVKLLPFKCRFNPGLMMHIYLHSKMQNKYSDNKKKIEGGKISKEQLKLFIDNLYNIVNSINLPKEKTEWSNYYSETNYSKESFENKKELIKEFTSNIAHAKVIDFGANTGVFSRLFKDSEVYSLDIDEMAVEYNYKKAVEDSENNITPLVYDISNPSPAVGFENRERPDLPSRLGEADLVLALALMHHLRITSNIPFERQAEYFKKFGRYLVIEYVSKTDSKVRQMLTNRADVFNDYTIEGFEKAFKKSYKILKKTGVNIGDKNNERILYLMERV